MLRSMSRTLSLSTCGPSNRQPLPAVPFFPIKGDSGVSGGTRTRMPQGGAF